MLCMRTFEFGFSARATVCAHHLYRFAYSRGRSEQRVRVSLGAVAYGRVPYV